MTAALLARAAQMLNHFADDLDEPTSDQEAARALALEIEAAVEALAASEARQRTLRAMIADLPGQLMNLAIDLETGKTKATVSRGLRDVAKRFYQAPLPDAPAPETGSDA